MAKQDVIIEVGAKDNGAGSLLDNLSRKAKQLAREDALSGENALGRVLGGGVGGVANFGLSALGYGAAGLATSFASKAAGSLFDSLREIDEGKKKLSEVLDTFARGIPIIGDFGAMLDKGIQLFFGSLDTFNEKAGKATDRRIEIGTIAKESSEAAIKAIIRDNRIVRDAGLSDGQKARNAVLDRVQDELAPLRDRLSKLQALETKDSYGFDTTRDDVKRAIQLTQNAINSRIAVGSNQEQLPALQMISKEQEEFRKKAEQVAKQRQSQEQQKLSDAMRSMGRQLRARQTSRDEYAQLLALSGRGDEATKLLKDADLRDQIDQMAVQLGETGKDPARSGERFALLRSIANAQALLGRETGVAFSNQAAPASDRFSTGTNEALLSRTAQADTAKNTKDLVAIANKNFDKLSALVDTMSGSKLTVAVLSAVGNK